MACGSGMVLAACLGMMVGGCRYLDDRPSVFVIVVDALRPDQLGCYGYQKETSPNIDQFARVATRFETAVTVFPRTTPSAISMLTGTYPHSHGVRSLTTRRSRELDQKRKYAREYLDKFIAWASGHKFESYNRALKQAVQKIKRHQINELFEDWIESQAVPHPTLGELLREEGYLTATFANHPILRRVPYYLRGFDKRVFVGKDRRVTEEAIKWLEFVKRWELPVFVLIWYLDPHFPYHPSHHDLKRFAGESKLDIRRLLSRGKATGVRAFNMQLYNQEEVDYMVAAYDAEIFGEDKQVGRFLNYLKKGGWYDDATVILTSDHGESLGEHDFRFEHGEYYYDATALVPLLIKRPHQKTGEVISHQVRTIDLFPSVLGLAGLDRHDCEGKNLFPDTPEEKKELESLMAFGENDFSLFSDNPRRYLKGTAGKWRIARTNRFKLIFIPHPEKPIFEFYDIKNDPTEKKNLISDPAHQDEIKRLKGELFGWIKKKDLTDEKPLNQQEIEPDTLEQVRSLGYVE